MEHEILKKNILKYFRRIETVGTKEEYVLVGTLTYVFIHFKCHFGRGKAVSRFNDLSLTGCLLAV